MAKFLNLNLAATGSDTTNIAGNSNISNYAELVNQLEVDDIGGNNYTLPASMAATDFFPTFPAGTDIYWMAVFRYNAAEATPEVDIDVDSVGVVRAGDFAGGIVTTTLEIATPNVANPVNMQIVFYTRG